MSSQYYYLSASLPMLDFGIKPPLAYDDFLQRCREQLTYSDLKIIERSTIAAQDTVDDGCAILRQWKKFNLDLHNELVWLRAAKKGQDALKYIRGSSYRNPFAGYSAQQIFNQSSVLAAEQMLDKVRWEEIEHLKAGHFFDIEFLVSFALQLQILERWDNINQESGMKVVDTMAGEL